MATLSHRNTSLIVTMLNLYSAYVVGSRITIINIKVKFVHASENLILLRDNAPIHRAPAVTAFLQNKQIKMLQHPVRQI